MMKYNVKKIRSLQKKREMSITLSVEKDFVIMIYFIFIILSFKKEELELAVKEIMNKEQQLNLSLELACNCYN